jgi:hypothetical protein
MKISKKISKKELLNSNVPKSSVIFKSAWLDLSSFWRALVGITFVYVLLYFVFVGSFGLLPTSDVLKADIEASVGEGAGRVLGSTALVGISVLEVTAASNNLLQLLLFLIASCALIWAVRRQRGLKKISVLQSYYEGPSNLIALIITMLLLFLTLIPSAIASAVLGFGLPIAGSGIEVAVLYIFAILLIVWTLYMLSVWWPAFYISMLPGTRPVASMRAARSLTKHRRLKITGRVLVIVLALLSLFVVIVFPVALLWQRIIPLTVYLTVMAIFCIGNILFFNLYRSLIDESKSQTKN